MDIKKEKTKGLNFIIEAHIPNKDIEPIIEQQLLEKGETATLTGFRKGKAPLNILRQKYGNQVMNAVFEKTISTGIDAYIKKKDLKIAGHPDIEVQSYDEKKGLEIKIAFELLPELNIPKFDAIKLNRLIVKNPEDRLDDALFVFSRQHKTEEPLKKDRAAKLNDVAIIDFEGFVDGKSFEGGKGKDHHLTLGSSQFIPGFEDQIVGKKKGDSFDVNVSFPKEYHAPNLAGKKSTFKVLLKDIKETVEAKIDDALAKKSGFENISKLKDAMKKHLKTEAKNTEHRYLKRQLLTNISDNLKAEVPTKMLDSEIHAIWSDYEKTRKTDKTLEKITEEAFKKEHSPLAKRRILLGLALAEIGDKLKVKLDPEDVRNEVLRYAQQYPGQEKKIFQSITSNKDALMKFQAPLYEDKVVDEILKKVTVTDKNVDMKGLLQAIDKLEEDALKNLEKEERKSNKTAS